MPTYTYLCNWCHRHFPVRCSIECRDHAQQCPECKTYDTQKVVDAPNFVVRGYNAKNGYSK